MRHDNRIAAQLLGDIASALLARPGSKAVAGKSEITCRCPDPNHDDGNPSARFNTDKGVWHCFRCENSGRSAGAFHLAGLLGIDTSRNTAQVSASTGKRTQDAEYFYHDEAGTAVLLVRRYIDDAGKKSFLQFHPVNGRWEAGGIPPEARPLYRLPEMLAYRADAPNDWIYIAEGEKCCDALAMVGLTATSNVGGAGKWPDIPQSRFASVFKGARVAVLPDHDEPGRQHAESVANSIAEIAAIVKVIDLPGLGERKPNHGLDIVDWFGRGHSADELRELVETAQPWKYVVQPPPYKMVRLSQVTPEAVDWLWKPYIARRAITLFDGDPGLGKSLVTIDLSARLSTGREWPNGSPNGNASNVILVSAEDDPAFTIRPRIDVAGGNPDLVHVLQGRYAEETDDGYEGLSFPDDISRLASAIRATNAALVVIDPLMAYLGKDTNSFRDQDVRRAMAPLAEVARDCNTAIVIVRHLNKSLSQPAMYRGGGSIGIIAASRNAYVFGRNPEDESGSECIIACTKANLGSKPDSLSYVVESSPHPLTTQDIGKILWKGRSDYSADALVTPDDQTPSKLSQATEWLKDLLSSGPVEALQVQRLATTEGIKPPTLRRAKEALRITARSIRNGAGHIQRHEWILPDGTFPNLSKLPTSAPDDHQMSNFQNRSSGDHLDGLENASCWSCKAIIDQDSQICRNCDSPLCSRCGECSDTCSQRPAA